QIGTFTRRIYSYRSDVTTFCCVLRGFSLRQASLSVITTGMTKRIAIAADHAGFAEKERMKQTLDEIGVEYEDMGTDSPESVDYPDFAERLGKAVAKGDFDEGILFCGSGTGMAIAA